MPIWYAADLDNYDIESCFNLVYINKKVVKLQVENWKHLLIVADTSLEACPASVTLSDSDFTLLKDCLGKYNHGLYKKGSLLINCEDELFRVNWRRSVPKDFSSVHILKNDPVLIRKSLNKYKAFLSNLELSSSAAVLLGLQGGDYYFRQQIAHNFPQLVVSLLTNDKETFIEHGRKLVGLGRGLTPTGDDMLHGLIVAYHYYVNKPAYMDAIRLDFEAVMANTNVFGRHILEIGFRGLTSEAYILLLRTIACGEADSKLLNKIISLGSSSGLDIAIAIFYFLDIIAE